MGNFRLTVETVQGEIVIIVVAESGLDHLERQIQAARQKARFSQHDRSEFLMKVLEA